MNLTSPSTIKEIMSKHRSRPSKTMGQNFLIDKNTLDKIIKASNLNKEDVVLEVGPGIGTLTTELAKYVKKVIAVEKDRLMLEILKETLVDYKNIDVIQDDVLKFDVQRIPKNYKLVANIPYYLTSPLIRKFLEEENRPKEIVLMIQKEVAQRVCSKPPEMSLLAISVQFYAEAKIISYVSKNCFWPAPKIDSAIIKITPKENNKNIDTDLFFKIVKAGFSQPRKQLSNNLSKSLKIDRGQINSWLLQNKISPKQRAETLSVKDWVGLVNNFYL